MKLQIAKEIRIVLEVGSPGKAYRAPGMSDAQWQAACSARGHSVARDAMDEVKRHCDSFISMDYELEWMDICTHCNREWDVLDEPGAEGHGEMPVCCPVAAEEWRVSITRRVET